MEYLLLTFSTWVVALAPDPASHEGPMKRSWFSKPTCDQVQIATYESISSDTPTHTISVLDTDALRALRRRIEALPVDGDKMKSHGETARLMTLTFRCEEQEEVIQIIEGKIKTPSTGFLSGNSEAETLLVQDIETLFAPGEQKRLLKIRGHEWVLPDFSLTYLGSQTEDHAPATVTVTRERYSLKIQGRIEELVITSGQRPAAPAKFSLGSSQERALYTYQTPKGDRLMPDVIWVQ